MPGTKTVFKGIIAFTSILALASCGSEPTGAPGAGGQNAALTALVDEVSAQVSVIRHLPFKRKVKVGVITREQFAAQMSGNIGSGYAETETAALTKEYAQLGLLPDSGSSLDSVLIDYYTNMPAAYYVPGTDSIYLLSDSKKTDRETRFYVSHELTHALQDQNLETRQGIFPAYSSYNSDSHTAQLCLSEGDATMVMFLYAAQYFVNSPAPFGQMQYWVGSDKEVFLTGNDTSLTNPLFMSVRGYAPYVLGSAYAAGLCVSDQQWDSINVKYSVGMIPRSTAQIVKGVREEMRCFDFQRINTMLADASLTFADDDNMGFCLLLGMFYGELDDSQTRRALDWRGDRYVFVTRAGEKYGTLVWALSFANAEAAQYMGVKIGDKVKSMRLDNTSPFATVAPQIVNDTTIGGTITTWTSSFDVKVVVAGNEVWMIQNAGTRTQDILNELNRQRTTPVLAKSAQITSMPGTLSPEKKRRVVDGVMGRLFR